MKKIVLIDHFDSFVYNLQDELQRQGATVSTYRSTWPLADALAYINKHKPDLLVLSPGPGAPSEARLYGELLQYAPPSLPIFGVCLGHQAMVEYFGGVVSRGVDIVHGKASTIIHTGTGLFAGLPTPLTIGRYHSLVATTMPACLVVDAHTVEGIVMAIHHRERPLYGVQFHPESVLTPEGPRMIANLLKEIT